MRRTFFLFALLCIVFVVPYGISTGQNNYVSFRNGETPLTSMAATMPIRTVVDKGTEYIDVEYIFPGAAVSDKSVDYNNSVQIFQFLNISGFGKMTEVGFPAVPSRNDFIAVPQNAKVKITILETESKILSAYNIHPALKPASERKGDPSPVFEMNEKCYSTDAFYPESIGEIMEIHKIRGNSLAMIQIHPVQFNPVKKEIRVYYKIKYRIVFEGSSKSFAAYSEKNSNHFTSLMKNIALNNSSIPDGVDRSKVKSGSNKDYIIITYAAFKPAADSLAKWKNQLGYSTDVVSKASWTVQQVKDSIALRYNNWTPKPDYFVIIGDHDQVPGEAVSNFVTDLYYSCMDGISDYIADMAKGRISVSNLTEAMTVVNKIIDYEKTPVHLASFYSTGLNCAFFQDYDDYNTYEDRRFSLTSEDVRNYLISPSLGYTVNRVYKTETSVNPTYWNDGYYANSEPLPASLLKPGFAWDGDNVDINTEINNGRFYVLHRDHGYEYGWGDPGYSNTDIDALTNGSKLPVVFSINCLTGKFLETECFSEKFLRKANGGAVGVFGHAEVSYSGYNDALAIGMFDAIWATPGMPFSFSGSGWANPSSVLPHTAINTMGDVVNQSLFRMAETWDEDQYTRLLLHYFGDPAMKMWTAYPTLTTATHQAGLVCGATSFTINSSNCADGLATIYYHGELVGKTQLIGGAGTITFLPLYFTPENAILTISKNNYEPYIANIPVTGTCNFPPNNQFVANNTSVCTNTTVNFTDQSVMFPTSWNWIFTPSTITFVGGTNAGTQHPQVQFNNTGLYTVELRTSNVYGADTLVKTAYVEAYEAIADFYSPDTAVCIGNHVTFYDDSECSPSSYQWNFGAGASPATAFGAGPHQVVYSTSGLKNVSLTVNGTITEIKNNYIAVNTGVGIPAFAQAFEGATFPPALWSLNNPDAGTTWVRSTAPAGNGTSIASAFINMYSYSSYGQKDELVSPTVDMTGIISANLTFKIAYAEYSSSYHDSLLVFVSNDCGFTYNQTPIYAKTGAALATSGTQNSQYTPSIAADWRTEIVDLTSYIGSIVNVKFVSVNGYGNNLYLDDININTGVATGEIAGNEYGLEIYPNPAGNDFLVSYSVPEKNDALFSVSDMNGRIVFKCIVHGKNKQTIHSADFAAGIYNIAVSGENINLHKKLVIVK